MKWISAACIHNWGWQKLKVLVIGIDGASPILVERWLEDLPTFQRIKKEGYFGISVPPTPAQTPVAWTTFMTGKNPGKHDIFSFIMRQRKTYERQIAQPAMIKSKTLWTLLCEKEKRVGIINVPMSDMKQVKGFIIPGFLAPTEGIPNPELIQKKLTRKFGIQRFIGDVETEVLLNVKKEPLRFFDRVNQITEETAQISLFLAEEENWDFFMTVLMGTDRIQHFFWRFIDPNHQKYKRNQFTELVREYYKKIDGILKKFLDIMDKETIMIVLSDHGFCPVHSELVINNYLEESGFLKIKNERIDLLKSKAVSYGYGDIWLNVKGREPQGLIESGKEYETTRNTIIQKLRELRFNSEKPFKDIKKREEIYWGNNLRNSPDLVAIFNLGWQAARRPEIMKKHPSRMYVNRNPRWSGGHDGTHDPVDVPGIIGFVGRNIHGPKEVMVHLQDMAPTILQIMDIPIPEDMDGQPMVF
ncbi:MAG: alkaline phosphatase family protein [Candidatus Bathyarchaeota archaeon]|nr:MAG: alkaline phosphatase family protein [Candidatus Bathyarchaeota archaeon]